MKLPNSYGSVIKLGGNGESPTLSVSQNLWKTIPGRSSENTPTWLISPNRKWLTPILLNTIAEPLFQSI